MVRLLCKPHNLIPYSQNIGSVPISGTVPFWTPKSLCFETYPAVKIGLYPLQGHYPRQCLTINRVPVREMKDVSIASG
jgi:hypothetical protein